MDIGDDLCHLGAVDLDPLDHDAKLSLLGSDASKRFYHL